MQPLLSWYNLPEAALDSFLFMLAREAAHLLA